MSPEDRREAVEQMLVEDPAISQRIIAEVLRCSQATICRDIAALRADSVLNQIAPRASRGDSLVARLRSEMAEQGLIPTSGEEELLAVAKDLADRIVRLQKLVAVDGERREERDGRIVMHPCLSEIRQCEGTLARVVNGIQTMEAPQKNRVKQRAAETRWRSHNLRKLERDLKAGETHGA